MHIKQKRKQQRNALDEFILKVVGNVYQEELKEVPKRRRNLLWYKVQIAFHPFGKP